MNTAPQTPYSTQLGNREPIATMRAATERLRELTSVWTPQQFERTYAPGKWTARQIVIHLAQTELALGMRARMALATPNYVAQPFSQDAWMKRESTLGARDAVEALVALVRLNTALYESLSAAERQTPLSHPEYGALTVDWIIHQQAGHQLHHLAQLEGL